jgi:hypothetical protein
MRPGRAVEAGNFCERHRGVQHAECLCRAAGRPLALKLARAESILCRALILLGNFSALHSCLHF